MRYPIPQDMAHALRAEHRALSQIVDNAVDVSFRIADLECVGAPGEVDKLLSFFLEGVETIEVEFNRILSSRGLRVSIAAIFTHQTPMVQFPEPTYSNRCELADLCILATYNEPLGPTGGLGNSILIQAKNDFDSDSTPAQRELYEHALRFDYYRPAALVGAAPAPPPTRNLPPKPLPVLAYWELRDRWWIRGYPVTALLWAAHVLYGTRRRYGFGSSLVDFLAGSAGYGFRRPAAAARDWSRIMFDLLSVTAEALVNRRSLNIRGAPRGIGPGIRDLLLQMRIGAPAVILNSLPEILDFYSKELGEVGRYAVAHAEKVTNKHYPRPKGDGGDKPPILGDSREYEQDGGGAGNIILFHFSRT